MGFNYKAQYEYLSAMQLISTVTVFHASVTLGIFFIKNIKTQFKMKTKIAAGAWLL